MARIQTRAVSDEARRVLARCRVEHDAIIPPSGQLDLGLAQEVSDVMKVLGATWMPSRRAYVFADLTGDDLVDAFYVLVETGNWERPRDHGYYPTPAWLAERMIEAADIEPFHRVLEPSAGQGAILEPLSRKLHSRQQLAIYEILPQNRAVLEANGYRVDGDDFLAAQLDPLFDRVVMHPPFYDSAAPKHVRRAMGLLKPGGKLVAVMPNNIIQRQDRQHAQVRMALLLHGTIRPLPDEVFKVRGTMVRTVLVTYIQPAEGTGGQAPSVPSRLQEPPEPPKVTTAPPRRFRRLSVPSRRFARPKRRQQD